MKTTVELPDGLMAAAKALAVRRRTTLKALFIRALERELRGPGDAMHPRFEVDESGWPVLKRAAQETAVVTEALIRDLRDAEGV